MNPRENDSQAALDARLAALSPKQRELFERALKEREAKRAAVSPPAPVAPLAGETVPRREVWSPCPLSIDQERLWFVQQLDPESPVYNIYSAFRYRSPLKHPVFERAANEIVRRHEILRTSFPAVDGRPIQVIAPHYELAIPLIDLTGLPDAAREAAAQRASADIVRAPFHLDRLPLLRLPLVQVDRDEYIQPFAIHHLVTDRITSEIVLAELTAIYAAYERGLPSPLPEIPVQFADFAVWQRKALAEEGRLAESLAYWRDKLAGAPDLHALPTDRPRPPVQSARGGRRRMGLGRAQSEALRAFAGEQQVTLFIAGLAVLQSLMVRLSGEERVIVGTPMDYRTEHPELASCLGFFLNQIVLDTDLSGNPTFVEVVARVRDTALGAYRHGDLPFARLVEELRPDRDLSRTPFTQVVFLFLNLTSATQGGTLLPGIDASDYWVDAERTQFDINFALWDDGPRFSGFVEYSTDLWDPATMDRLREQYRQLLEGGLADRQARLWDLPLLSPAERHQVVLEWAAATEAPHPETTLHALFQAQAIRTPTAVALTFADQELTYAELDSAANHLAADLQRAGVRPGHAVALSARRGPHLLIGLLAILKTGAYYVPVDPTLPADRIAFILEDSHSFLWLAEPDIAIPPSFSGAHLPLPPRAEGGSARPSPAGGEGESAATHPGTTPEMERSPAPGTEPALTGTPKGRDSRASEDDGSGRSRERAPRPIGAPFQPVDIPPGFPAYVIYTSGSTGTPKGVAVTHAQVARLFTSTDRWLHFSADDVWTLFHSYAFDFSVWEIWGAFLNGGRLVVVSHATSRQPVLFAALLQREGVTVLSQTPSAFLQLAELPIEPFPSLRAVIFGGEALDPRGLRSWIARHGDDRPALINMYGITETTVHVTYRRIRREDVEGWGSPIGVPIRDLSLYLLDPFGRPVPIGVAGEMFVGGAGVAVGYPGRPELTAERFLPDPWGSEPGARLYKSGDLARRRANGELDYLARADHQVKIRGFRIEPAEIESALLKHPGVAQAAVVTRRDGLAGDRRLVAYWVPAMGHGPTSVIELRHHLAALLPEHMVPAAFVPLLELPLTANGKLDRKALPAPSGERPTVGRFSPPRTPAEEVLAAIWAQVLGLDRVGIDDNFFALGGDSILSLRVVAEAGRRGFSLTLQDLFRHQTIADLAAASRRAGEESVTTAPFGLISAADRTLLPDDAEDAYPLARLQAGMLYHMALDPDEPPYHNVDSLFLRGEIFPGPLQEAVRRVVARHAVLRTSFHLSGFSQPLQVVHREAHLPVEIEDLSRLSEEEQTTAVLAKVEAEKRRVFDLTRAPQLRLHLFLRGGDRFQLTLTENHAIFDGWSLHATLREIFDLHYALAAGEDPAPLPAFPTTYRDYIALELAAAASPEARAFWEKTLTGAPLAALPEWPRPESPRDGGRRTRSVSLALSADEIAGLKALARRAAVPLKSLLLAAHFKALSLLSGQVDVVTGVVSNGRLEVPGGDDVRGLFLNTLPLRAAVGQAGSWLDLVQAAFRAEEEMLPFRRYPFAELHQEAERPLFTVPFNYVHFHVVRDLAQSGRLELLGFERAEGGSFPLLVAFHQDAGSGGIGCELEYDSHRLGQDRVEGIAALYHRVLAAMAAEPEAAPRALDLLGEEERDRALAPARPALRPAARLTDLFEEIARREPGRVALLAADGSCTTYGELLERARALAAALVRRGAGPEVPVGLLAGRGPERIEGSLAILLAGAAFLPLDPRHPVERHAALLADAGAPILLAERQLLGGLPFAGTVVDLQESLDRIPLSRPERGDRGDGPGAEPQDLAYLIYTSGSTGRPKGVAIEHQSATALLGWSLAHFAREELAYVLASTSAGFDMSIFELFAPLSAGGALVLVDDLFAWPAHPAAGEVTLVNTVPSLLAELLRRGDPPPAVPTVNLGGEALKPELARRVFAAGVRRLLNLYGPTEDTTYSTWAEIPADLGGLPAIGRPVEGTAVRLLNASLDPVPAGAPGEVYLTGAGLARGYFRRPDLTAERFVPDPWGEPGSRAYRTGDLARLDASGELSYLGRIDHQLKLHGVRIEPAEIEAALEAHPGISEAAVLLATDAQGQPGLLACWAASAEGGDPGDLRAWLRDRLPEALVPAAFAELPALPRNANGKLDRRALAGLVPALPLAPGASAEFVPPANPIEEVLAGIWAEVLRLDPGDSGRRVGRGDNFFDLAGDSLTATQVGHRVREVFGVEIPLRRLFERTSLAELAAEIEALAQGKEGASPSSRAVVPVPRTGPVPASFIQEWGWYLLGGPVDAKLNMPNAVRFQGHLDPAVMRAVLAELDRRHESLRTRFAELDGRLVQLFVDPAPVPLPEIDLSTLPEEPKEASFFALARLEANRPFHLVEGPLFRAVYVRLGGDRHALLFNIHHLISDGWTLEVLKGEIAALYTAVAQGRPSPLPPLPVQYGDFALWQRQVFAERDLEAQLAYWRRRLSDRPPVLDLPADRPRPERLGSRAVKGHLHVSPELLEGLRRVGRQEGATLAMVLLAAVDTLLYRYTGREDILVNSIFSGRNRPELAGLIGLFMNTVVVRADLSGRPPFRELLRRVRNSVVEAYAHQDVPFMRLLEDLFPGRKLERTLFSRVNFNLLSFAGVGGGEGEGGVALETFSLMEEQVKVDLHVIGQEGPASLYLQLLGAADLFDSGTIERMAADLHGILREAAADPGRPIDRLPPEPRIR